MMEFAKLSAPTLKELFVKELETRILSGKLEIGAKLPSERDLAEQMQVSRAVVNGGINELARKGFLIVKPRSGIYVSDYRRTGTVEALQSIMNYNGGQLHKDEVRSILELKLVIDTLSSKLAAKYAKKGDLEILKNKLAQMNETGEDIKKAAEAAFDFYHELSIVGGNILLPLIYRSFHIPVIHLWERFIHKYGNDIVYKSAKTVFEAVSVGDEEAAMKAVNTAISGTIEGRREIYEE